MQLIQSACTDLLSCLKIIISPHFSIDWSSQPLQGKRFPSISQTQTHLYLRHKKACVKALLFSGPKWMKFTSPGCLKSKVTLSKILGLILHQLGITIWLFGWVDPFIVCWTEQLSQEHIPRNRNWKEDQLFWIKASSNHHTPEQAAPLKSGV